MHRSGLTPSQARRVLRHAAETNGWSLCIGAGTSLPLFPSWETLVSRLLAEFADPAFADTMAGALLSEFSADAAIQGVRNSTGCSEDDFTSKLAAALYRDIRANLTAAEWEAVSIVLARPGKKAVSKRTWKTFLNCFESSLAPTSALQVARVLAPLLGGELQPTAVLSFNAETLLLGLLNAMTWRRDTANGSKVPIEGENRQLLDAVTRGISNRQRGRVAYIFCHGVLPVPDRNPIAPLISTDKLVFSEASYLQLASTSFSWQSSAFLEVCSSKTVVFLGVSLADPNMRRWLSWVYENRLRELEILAGSKTRVPSTPHFWLRARPKDPRVMPWIEASVAHLGVRLVWMKDWSEVESTLQQMLDV